jgi:hypothetical protein
MAKLDEGEAAAGSFSSYSKKVLRRAALLRDRSFCKQLTLSSLPSKGIGDTSVQCAKH